LVAVIRPASIALLLLLAGPAGAATVLSVGDGDTLRVSDGGKRLTIRMACIDAPETAQRPYGAASRQRLQELAPVGSVVTLRPQTIDKYGRTVAEMFRNGQNVNLAMVSSGQAFAYRKYLAACDGFAYLGAEAAAQRQRVGVWSVHGGIQRPWDWRKGGQAAAPSAPAGGYSGRKLTCRQIGSFGRAQELLKQGHTYLDRNGVGWPANRCGEHGRRENTSGASPDIFTAKRGQSLFL
jgi:endonuclease YncB( thermonuclease family)